jgi:hypothetical protein
MEDSSGAYASPSPSSFFSRYYSSTFVALLTYFVACDLHFYFLHSFLIEFFIIFSTRFTTSSFPSSIAPLPGPLHKFHLNRDLERFAFASSPFAQSAVLLHPPSITLVVVYNESLEIPTVISEDCSAATAAAFLYLPVVSGSP